MQKWWQNKPAVVATIALVIFIVKEYLHYDIPHIDELVNLLIALLTTLGIWYVPTNRR